MDLICFYCNTYKWCVYVMKNIFWDGNLSSWAFCLSAVAFIQGSRWCAYFYFYTAHFLTKSHVWPLVRIATLSWALFIWYPEGTNVFKNSRKLMKDFFVSHLKNCFNIYKILNPEFVACFTNKFLSGNRDKRSKYFLELVEGIVKNNQTIFSLGIWIF